MQNFLKQNEQITLLRLDAENLVKEIETLNSGLFAKGTRLTTVEYSSLMSVKKKLTDNREILLSDVRKLCDVRNNYIDKSYSFDDITIEDEIKSDLRKILIAETNYLLQELRMAYKKEKDSFSEEEVVHLKEIPDALAKVDLDKHIFTLLKLRKFFKVETKLNSEKDFSQVYKNLRDDFNMQEATILLKQNHSLLDALY